MYMHTHVYNNIYSYKHMWICFAYVSGNICDPWIDTNTQCSRSPMNWHSPNDAHVNMFIKNISGYI